LIEFVEKMRNYAANLPGPKVTLLCGVLVAGSALSRARHTRYESPDWSIM
jgi:hypothetical protein